MSPLKRTEKGETMIDSNSVDHVSDSRARGDDPARSSMRVSVKDAARLMGVSEQFIRIGMQRDRLPIGRAVKLSTKWTYYISPALLEQFVVGLKKAVSGN